MSARDPERPERLVDVSGWVYGVRLQGRLPGAFADHLRPLDGRPAASVPGLEVGYRVVRRRPRLRPLWASEPTPETSGRLALSGAPDAFALSVDCEGSGLFRVTPRSIDIEWLAGGAGASHYFISYALPLWLEARGMPVLHASAVCFGNRAVAFVGPSGTGKSTLCAALVRSGCRFVADDGLPLARDAAGAWRCAAGPPWLRLWPSGLERVLGIPAERLPRVLDSLEKRLLRCPEPQLAGPAAGIELAAVYVLTNLSGGEKRVEIAPCTPRDGVIHLIEHSLAGAPAAALGLSGARFERLTSAASQVPVRLLRASPGRRRWRLIREAVIADLSPPGAQPASDGARAP